MQIFNGFLFSTVISVAAWRLRSLSVSGAIAAAITGGVIFGLGGLPWAGLLIAFFVSSSLLSKIFKQKKTSMAEKFAKGNQRDWGQVAANGGMGLILVLIGAFLPAAAWVWAAYAGALATVNADTWATEIGVLKPNRPRLITTGQKVAPGTSGGVSVWGSLATLGGAALIGLAGVGFMAARWAFLAAVILGGVCGAFFDSLLGATVQAIYFCPQCHKDTEQHPQHRCGNPTELQRGWPWLQNDLVNFLASAAGALIAAGVFLAF